MSDHGLPQAAVDAAAEAMQAREHRSGEDPWRENAKVAIAAARPHLEADAVAAERERCAQLVHGHLVRVCATRGAASAAAGAVRAIHADLRQAPGA